MLVFRERRKKWVFAQLLPNIIYCEFMCHTSESEYFHQGSAAENRNALGTLSTKGLNTVSYVLTKSSEGLEE